MRNLKTTLRHGLLTQRILSLLKSYGLDFHPFYMLREGAKPDDLHMPDLDAEFHTSVLIQDEVQTIAELSPWATLENVQGRVDKGHLCLVMKHEEDIAGYTWANFSEINEPKCSYELKAGEVYLYDAFIAPAYRGRDLAPYMRNECYKYLRSTDNSVFYSLSDYFNKPAIRFKIKLNAEIIRLYLHISIGKYQVGNWVLKNYE